VALSQMNDLQRAGLDLERRFRRRAIAQWQLNWICRHVFPF
jgi:hypothetical protein